MRQHPSHLPDSLSDAVDSLPGMQDSQRGPRMLLQGTWGVLSGTSVPEGSGFSTGEA